jgi:hypothetical protein
MDQRDIESIVNQLEDERRALEDWLSTIIDQLRIHPDDNELLEEFQNTEFDIKDIELDIGVYVEMLNKYYQTVVGDCGFPCDGNCQSCGGYDPRYEIMTAGDF